MSRIPLNYVLQYHTACLPFCRRSRNVYAWHANGKYVFQQLLSGCSSSIPCPARTMAAVASNIRVHLTTRRSRPSSVNVVRAMSDKTVSVNGLPCSSSSSSIYLDKTKHKCQGHVGAYMHRGTIHDRVVIAVQYKKIKT